jgi:hypothetical protein
MKVSRKMKNASKLLVSLLAVAGVFVVGDASATSLLDASTTTAIGSGWTDLKDTFLALLNTSWAPFLGVSAIAMSPMVIKKMFKASTH